MYPIGKLLHSGTSKATLVFKVFSEVPQDAAGRHQLHNWLVEACQVSLRQWTEALSKAHSKAAKKRPGEESLSTQPPEG